MVAYVTLEEQKEYSRIQHSGFDTTILIMIEASSAAVKNYLKDFSPYEGERNDDDDYVLDSNYEPEIKVDASGNQIVKPEVKLAVMLEVDRHINMDKAKHPAQMNYLSDAAISLLYPLRDPALK